jgi:hypothetical protein
VTADDFVATVDGLTFEENGRTWTLEVDDIDTSMPDSFVVTVRIPGIDGEMRFDARRDDRFVDATALRRRVMGMARQIVVGRHAVATVRSCD